MPYKTTKDEQELGKEIDEQFQLAKRYLDPIHERMNSQEELYRTYLDKENYPHGAKVFDPRIFRVIETITPRMVASEPTGSFYPAESSDENTAEILNALIKYDWNQANMFEKLVRYVKSMLIFGTSFGRTYWDFRERDRYQMVPKKLNGRLVWTPKEKKIIKVTEYDAPNFEVLNIYDCYPDPNATHLDNMRWFIYRAFKTLDELKRENDTRGMEYWKNLDKLEEAIDAKNRESKSGGDRPDQIQYREHRRTMLSTQELLGEDESNPDITILVRYTRESWVFVAPEYGNLIIREVENPYFHGELPIIYGVDYPYPGELYGMGEIEPIDRIQRAINAVLNQRLDNVQLTLNTMWKIKKNSGVDLNTLYSAPGNVVSTDDMSSVEMLQVPDVTGGTFVNTMNYLTSALQNGSGITDYTIGIDNQSNVANKTATGTRLIQQEANAQFKLKIQLFNHMVVERIANQWKDLRIQFTTEEQQVRIVGKDKIRQLRENTDLSQTTMEGEPIVPGDDSKSKLEIGKGGNFAFLNLSPEDIQPAIVGNYDFIATTSSEAVMDPTVLEQNFFLALDRVKDPDWVQGLAMENKKLNYSSLTEKLFDKLNLGIEMNDVVEEMKPQDPTGGAATQPLGQEEMDMALGEPMGNPLANPLQNGQQPAQY
jgi:hypothetical protein